MKKELIIENLGKMDITYSFNGKFTITLNGKELPRSGKKEFYIDKDGVRKLIYITGSSVKGFEIVIEKETYKITDPLKGYVYFLAVLPFIFTMILGNIPYLAAKGFYYVGGAIGGLISGLYVALAIYLAGIYTSKKKQLLMLLLCNVLCFLSCLLIGNIIVWLL